MHASSKINGCLNYEGCNFFKQRLILSTLSGIPVYIKGIRSGNIEVGLREYEVSLIRLFDKITNGTTIEINESGTSVYYKPGLLLGGSFHHNCCIQRGIGYYLDALLAFGPFCKEPLNVTLTGLTNCNNSPSVDHIKAAAFPILKKFTIVDDGLEMKILKRGLKPSGGGEVNFKCPVKRYLKPLLFMDQGMIKRFRGTAYAVKVSTALANRTVEAAKGVLLKFIPDVYLHTDHCQGKNSGNSPGYGINLVGETTTGVYFSSENVSYKEENKDLEVPEEIGRKAAFKILEEIYRGGCVDSTFQWLLILYMALGEKNISKCLTGPLSNYTVNFLRHIREFFSTTFKLENPEITDEDISSIGSQKVILTCMGVGYININKRVI